MAENIDFVKGVRDVADHKPKAARRSHPTSFNHLGITGCFTLAIVADPSGAPPRMGNGGNLEWHTDADPRSRERRAAARHQVYALAAFRLATASVLPFDWRALLKEFGQVLGGYAGNGARSICARARCGGGARCHAGRFAAAVDAKRIPPLEANDVVLALAAARALNYRRHALAPRPTDDSRCRACDLHELDRYPPNAPISLRRI